MKNNLGLLTFNKSNLIKTVQRTLRRFVNTGKGKMKMSKLEKIKDAVEKKKIKKVAKFTDDADSEVRAAAFEALGEFPGDEYVLEICQNTIRDNDPAVRLAVAKALKKIGNDHVVEALRHQMLHETDEALKKAFEDAMDACRERRF